MALNLSTLTSPATSGEVLAEVLTTADFLEPVPVLRNLARGSNKGGDAEQDVALNQPKALPLDANGKGYCYLPVTTGNAPAVTFPTIGASDDFVLEMDVYLVSGTNLHFLSGANADHRLAIYNDNFFAGADFVPLSSPLALGVSNIKIERTSGTITLKQNDAVIASRSNSSAFTFTHLSYNGQFSSIVLPLNGYIQKATLSIEGTEELNIDFTSTAVRHGDTKFKCATGQVVTINQSGNDPATIIKKPVLRFDGADDFMNGVFNQTITGGYMFAAFSALGDNGESSGRVFSVNSTGLVDVASSGAIFSFRTGSSNDLRVFQDGYLALHSSLFSQSNGDILHESLIKDGSQFSQVNDADEYTSSLAATISSEEFNILGDNAGNVNACLDLEYLALFPSLTDAQADAVRNYINKRNNVFYRWDTDGYYFFDPQKATFTGNFTAANTLDGYITGSDLGDTDVRSNLTLEQGTLNDQPSTDGYTITFNDSAEHLEFENAASQALAGWQVVGTSLGTFAYKVNSNAVTELNLLGNAGNNRISGDLYGIILLPASATGREIEQARKLLIDRGASDETNETVLYRYFDHRRDIVEFKYIDTSSVTNNVNFAWRLCTNMTSFPALDLSNCSSFSNTWRYTYALTSFPQDAKLGTEATNVNFTSAWDQSGITSFSTQLPTASNISNAFYYCTSLSDFGTTDIKNCSNFISAWQNCSSLTSFPADAKLGTDATGVNFTSAWRNSGLTSFSTPLPTATTLTDCWRTSRSLVSFDIEELPAAEAIAAAWYQCDSLTSFNTKLPSATSLNFCWHNCDAMVSFNVTELPSATEARYAWRYCGLNSFNTSLPLVGRFNEAWKGNTALSDFTTNVFSNWNPSNLITAVFDGTWAGCTSLTSQSVENILVSIDASGKYATTNGASGGTALADAGIDVDYDGSGLTAATTAAIDSLSGKGWQVYINGELVIPNILDLAPAAAYSLRSFDADADPNVVNVRRSSDGATSDFTASEVSDGTLVAWVGAGNDGHVTTWYDQSDNGNDSTQATASAQPKIVDAGTLVTEGGLAAVDFDEASDQHIVMSYSDLYGQSRLDSFYVTSTSDNTYLYPARTTSGSYHGLVADDGAVFSYISGSNYGTVNAYANNTLFTGTTRDEYHAATVGYKLISHENAQTVDWDSFNFGRYGTAVSSYSYTGKLQEMIFFNTDQSANRTGIEANINDHFDIYS
jgi:hypothetical protein